MLSKKLSRSWIPAVLLAFSLGLVYSVSMAPGLTWANNGADGGDLISATATGGIAHPSGYPTYLILARLFQFLPWGSIAFRTTLLSAVCTIAAAVLMYYLVIDIPDIPVHGNGLAGMIAGYAFGLSSLVWSQAVITEVYGLNVFFVAVILYLLLRDDCPTNGRWRRRDPIVGLVFGLSMGNHLTTLLLLPALLFLDCISRVGKGEPVPVGESQNAPWVTHWKGWCFYWKPMLLRLVGLGIGLLIYLILPIRAAAHPPVDWGDPVTIKNFLWLVSGRLYANRLFGVPAGSIFIRIRDWASQLLGQWGGFGLLLGLIGLFFGRVRSTRIYLITGWMLIVFSIFSIVYYSIGSSVYLIPALFAFSIWIGVGTAAIVDFFLRKARWSGPVAGMILLVYFIGVAVANFPKVDASKDQQAETYGQRVLASAPKDALLFTTQDEDTFTLWYFQYVLHERLDLTVMSKGLLAYPWYRDTLKSTYPTLEMPEAANGAWQVAIIRSNPSRPVCETLLLGNQVIECH